MTTATNSFEDIIFLLDSSGEIHDNTLNSIYDQGYAMIKKIGVGTYDASQKETITYTIAHDITQQAESKAADDLLKQI
ncbi:MAG: hypothetical protein NT085_01795 [candidate division SR1 bacterium]|nr:hypothetical protein [candidate division SR1 bacterium]